MPCVIEDQHVAITSNEPEDSCDMNFEDDTREKKGTDHACDSIRSDVHTPERKQTDNELEEQVDDNCASSTHINDNEVQEAGVTYNSKIKPLLSTPKDERKIETMDTSPESEPEDYEELIQRNIREKQKVLSSLFSDINMNEYRVCMPTRKKRDHVRTPKLNLPRRHLPPRSASKHASTRISLDDLSDDDTVHFSDEDEILENGKRRKVVIAFKPRAKRHHIASSEPRTIIPASEITELHLKNVADIVTEKVYSQSGTTCHQCRQKTKDMKTICRSSNCSGVRGYFCGPCLRNRYGEDARSALKDSEWKCPPCRNICNCSICRNRAGATATGILTPTAKLHGYASVKEYLDDHDKFIIKYEED